MHVVTQAYDTDNSREQALPVGYHPPDGCYDGFGVRIGRVPGPVSLQWTPVGPGKQVDIRLALLVPGYGVSDEVQVVRLRWPS